MAPLIDVVFLLLIFFMVATIFPNEQGLTIERPIAASAESLDGRELLFTIDRQGTIFHHGKKVVPASVTKLVKEHLAAKPDSQVLLEVDRHAATGSLIRLMDACKQGGAQRLGIVTEEQRPEE